MPLPRPDRSQVEAALEELRGWPEVLRSPQLSSFLCYVVSARLGGREASIKAYAIAVDVLGRPASFDPQSDPIVRVQARRLRRLLDDFYDAGLARSGVRIRLPVGGYVPEFEFLPSDGVTTPAEVAAAKPAPPWSPTAHFWRPLMLFAVIAGGVSLAAYLSPRTGVGEAATVDLPSRPVVVVGDFANLSGESAVDAVVAALGPRIAADLSRFEEIDVLSSGDPGAPAGGEAGEFLVLDGAAARSGDGLLITASLADGRDGGVIWSADASRPMPGAQVEDIVAGLSRSIVRDIAPFRGALHTRGRAWLNAQAGPLPAVNSYVCLLRYRYARERMQAVDIAAAIDCFDRLLQQGPEDAPALAARAWLDANVALGEASPDDPLPESLRRAAGQVARAVELAPDSSFAREQLAAVQDWLRQSEAAKENFAAAISLNPLNTDARAAYAGALGRAGEWALAVEQARLALADAAYPSPWYHYPLAIAALRSGQFEAAMDHGARLAEVANGEMGSLLTLAAAGHAGMVSSIPDYLARTMTMEKLRRRGIMPWIGISILDKALLELIEGGLRRAGVPQNALTQPF